MKKLLVLCAVFSFLAFSAVASATSISVDSGDWIDSRSAGSGITTSVNWGGFEIAWEISLSGSVYTYEYTISGELIPAVSHWILEVTAGSVANDFWDVSPSFSADSPGTFGTQPSNPSIPGNIYGLKWESGSICSVVFDTYKDPVWGDFYAKGGNLDNAWNTGFGTNPTSADFTNWIATPNGGTSIPEPGTMLLLGTGLIGLAGLGRKRFKRKEKSQT